MGDITPRFKDECKIPFDKKADWGEKRVFQVVMNGEEWVRG